MCNLYEQPPEIALAEYLEVQGRLFDLETYEPRPVGPNQWGIFLRPDKSTGALIGRRGQWGMIRPGSPPPRKGEKRYATNNARIESVHEKATFRDAWRRGQRCLIPAAWYAEPNWQTGKNIWWHLRRADGAPWMLAGIWDEWVNRETGEVVPNYTMLTVNCDDHPLLNRLHKPVRDQDTGDILPMDRQDKRSLVHVDLADWDRWLLGSVDEARALLVPQPSDVFDQADALRTDEALAAMAAPDAGQLF